MQQTAIQGVGFATMPGLQRCASSGQKWRVAAGFSLIEMLVVLAIATLIMSLLATAYHMELRAIRFAKAGLEMDNELRAFELRLRQLLRQRHFEGDLRVSDINMSDPNRRPRFGFFQITEGGPEPNPPGSNPQEPIYVKDKLEFTVRLIGNEPTSFFEIGNPNPSVSWGYPESRYEPVSGPSNARNFPVLRSQWARVSIYLQPQLSDEPINGPKLYQARMETRLIMPSHFAKGQADFDIPNISVLGPDKEILLQNVVSFDVKVVLNGSVTEASYDSRKNQPLDGIWIRIRIYNPKTQRLRDAVIVEAL